MVKGINKQIIEIKCTNNEYFDKILLFVCAEKAGLIGDKELLEGEAKKVCEGLGFGKRKREKSVLVRVLIGLSGLAALLFAAALAAYLK